MRTMLRNWKNGKARLQDLRGIGHQDRMSEFPRSQAMAPHTQAYCFPIVCRNDETNFLEPQRQYSAQTPKPVSARKVTYPRFSAVWLEVLPALAAG